MTVSNCFHQHYKCRLYVLTLATLVAKQIVVVVEIVSSATSSSHASSPSATKAPEIIVIVFIVVEISHGSPSSVSSSAKPTSRIATTTHHHAGIAAAHRRMHTSNAGRWIHHRIHARHTSCRAIRTHTSHSQWPWRHTSYRRRSGHHTATTVRACTVQSSLLHGQ
jgi:hypothetical protein